jgi:transcriptional regulator GlxA family with amidase domain
LELGRKPKQVAVRRGFANADTVRRAFVRHARVTPAEFRKRYANG